MRPKIQAQGKISQHLMMQSSHPCRLMIEMIFSGLNYQEMDDEIKFHKGYLWLAIELPYWNNLMLLEHLRDQIFRKAMA